MTLGQRENAGDGDLAAPDLEERHLPGARGVKLHHPEARLMLPKEGPGDHDREGTKTSHHPLVAVPAHHERRPAVADEGLERVVDLDRVARVVGPHGAHVIVSRAVAEEQIAEHRRDTQGRRKGLEEPPRTRKKPAEARAVGKVPHVVAEEPPLVVPSDDQGARLPERVTASIDVPLAVDDVSDGEGRVHTFRCEAPERESERLVLGVDVTQDA